jgi:poly-gamma-glutamate synthesis protein (capsule biosynthesis protein)
VTFRHPQHLNFPLRNWLLILGSFVGIVAMGFFWSKNLWARKSALDQPAPSQELPLTKALIVPHHDLLLDQFPSYYATFSVRDRQTIKHIILISPNHFEPAERVVKTRLSNFELSPRQVVPIDTDFLATASTIKGVVPDDSVFKKEHGVFLHLPFIAHYFPQVTITPLLLTRKIPSAVLDQVILRLKTAVQRDDTLLLVSSDFSHYLPYSQAEKNDEHTLALLEGKKSAELLQLSDDYSDCPGCLYVLIETLEANPKTQPLQILFHGNSAQFIPLSPDAPTTSYFVIKW